MTRHRGGQRFLTSALLKASSAAKPRQRIGCATLQSNNLNKTAVNPQPRKTKAMKKLILFACGVACAGSVLAQGTIVFNNRVVGSVVAPIYNVDPANPTMQTTGNTATGFPAGTTTYGGPLLSGSGFTVQLWCAPGANQAETSLVPALGYSESTFRTGAAAGLWTTSVNPAIIPNAAEATVATLELRVWDNLGGTVTDW